MAWNSPQQRQTHAYPPQAHMNLPQSQLNNQPHVQQNHQMNVNTNPQPQQPFPAYPSYPLHPMQNQMPYPMASNPSPAMYNQNYSMPMQSPYPSPYYGLQPMQSSQMISPFQRPPSNTMQNNIDPIHTPNSANPNPTHNHTQPLPQRFHFEPNDNSLNATLPQTQPAYMRPPPNEEEKELLIATELPPQSDDDDSTPKPRLEYSKIPRLGPKNVWVLNGKEALKLDTQIVEENKIFGDIETIENEMKQNNSVAIDGNTVKQNIRLFLQHKAKRMKQEDAENESKQILQPLLVYDHNLRPFYNPLDEYNRYGLLRMPPVTSHPSMTEPPITITLHLYGVQFKDLAGFTVEDYLTQQIIFDYKIYTNCLKNDAEFGTKITLLKTRVNQLLATAADTKSECIALLDELVSIRRRKDEMQSHIEQLFTTMYMNWRNIQSWRHNEGMYKFGTTTSSITYQGTPLRLYLKKVEPNRVQQELQYKEALMDELHEIEMLIKLKNIVTFDETSVTQSIIQRQKTHLMPPGTVHYIAYIDSHGVSQTSLCCTTERFRRGQLNNYSIFANVFVNNEENELKKQKGKRIKITSTKRRYAKVPSFTCDVQFELEIKLLHKPISIEIELRSNEWVFTSKQIANIEIPITRQSANMVEHETMFESDVEIAVNRYMTKEDYKTYIEGANGVWNRKVCGCVAYGIQIECKASAPVPVSVAVIPSDEEDDASERFMLVDEEDVSSTFRQKILKLRQRYAIGEDQMVPLFDADIPDALYGAVHDETKQEIAYRNEMILDRMNHATMDVSEVVCEAHHIDLLPCFTFSIYSLFKPRRRLRPKRSYFASQNDVNPSKCKIMVQILQSKHLPIRKSDNFAIQTHMMNTVEPFIEVSFMGNECRSFTSFGSNARWEQTLCVEFTPPGNEKYTPSNLQKISEDLVLNVFDEWVISKAPVDDRIDSTQIQRREKRYLGSIRIPFTAIYLNTSIEGVFQLDMPLILLGYTQLHQPLISLFATLDPPVCNQFNCNSNSIQRYYDWILTNKEEEKSDGFDEYCIEWSKSILNESDSDRSLAQIFVSNSRNESALVCRYLRGVEPPMQVTAEIFIRFVSRIPYKEDIHLIPGARDVWMTNEDFVRLGSGDGEEHTNLLACYFEWLDEQNPASGWSTYVVMGKGIVNGDQTMYVLRRKASLKHSGGVSIQNVILYDASSGLSYNVKEKGIDLHDVCMVYNGQQVYGNVQSTQIEPCSDQFNWEFENKEFWKPLFDNKKWKSQLYCLPSLQSPALQYMSSPNEYYMKRQNKLEYIIEKQFDAWRELPTKWNYAICKTLRQILCRLEPLCQNGGNIPQINQDPQIFAISQIYSKMYGFPLNIKDNGGSNLITENDENKAVELVYRTKVHQNDDPNAEFARAVYIYPYTNKIASVWIYIASLSKT